MSLDPYVFIPVAASEIGDATAADLVRLACMDYDEWQPSRAVRARRLLEAKPELARADVWTAAAVGDVDAVREQLERDPALVDAKGGALRWEPLLYACYSRLDSPIPGHSTLAVARLLLERGADPNAGFLWRGNAPPFTALTGAFGRGENGNNQPAHRDCTALAKLLLEAGADPNDGQTLYNRHFEPDDLHLRLLLGHGLGQVKGGPWYERCGARMGTPAGLLTEELWAALRKNYFERVKLLVAHGADVNARGRRDGRTPFESALLAGNREIADWLRAHGAREFALEPKEAFAAACVRGDRDEARALLARHPGVFDELGAHRRAELVHHAVESRRPEGLRLMAELGFDLDAMTRNTPMHDAAWSGDLELVKLLVELGASTHRREPSYHATPLGWANHNGQPAVVAWLVRFADLSDAIQCRSLERVEELLREDPSRAKVPDSRGRMPLDVATEVGDEKIVAAVRAVVASGGPG